MRVRSRGRILKQIPTENGASPFIAAVFRRSANSLRAKRTLLSAWRERRPLKSIAFQDRTSIDERQMISREL